MTDAERRAVNDEAQVLALSKAEEAGTLPKKDRRHEPRTDVGDIPLVEAVTAEAPSGEFVTFVAEPEPLAPVAEPVVDSRTLEEKVRDAFPPGYQVTTEDVARIRDGR